MNERYSYLKALSEKQPFYESEIVRLSDERINLIQGFAKGIRQENTIMFLRDIELSFPIEMSSLSFNEYEKTHVSDGKVNADGELEGDLTAVKSTVVVAYVCDYDQVKELLNYIYTYKEKMTISDISMSYNADIGKINGSFTFDQYAFVGSGRSIDSVKLPNIKHGGNETLFYVAPLFEEEEEETIEVTSNEESSEETAE